MKTSTTSSVSTINPPVTQATQNDPSLKKRISGSLPQASANDEVTENSLLLSDKQRVALELILTGATMTAVAKAACIGRKTLFRWRTEDQVFRDELRRRRSEILDSSVDRFRDLLGKSMDLLDKQLRDPYATISLRAARTVLVMSQIRKLAMPPAPTLFDAAQNAQNADSGDSAVGIVHSSAGG